MSFMRSMTDTAVFRAVSTPMESSVPGMSLSMVAGTPTVGSPSSCSASPPERLPPPPIKTNASAPASRNASMALCLPSSPSSNSEERPVPRAVPPRCTKPQSSLRSTGRSSPSSSPKYPSSTTTTSQPRENAACATARTAAFIPGATPPLVNTAIFKPSPLSPTLLDE